MNSWNPALPWGKRASDQPPPAPVTPRRDRLLEAVIAQEGIDVHYQPQIRLDTGRVIGAEALARWGAAASADVLFSRAAASGLSERLSRLMQRKALRAAATWEGPLRGLGMSINLLPADICRDNYEQWLLDEAEAAGAAPDRITLEITESALLERNGAVVDRLTTLRAAGFCIAVDDFGTGYASLAYLTSLPLDILKIDRGLVVNIVRGSRDRIVMQAMIRMAHDLGLQVLVEGVETSAQLELLNEWGCDVYQGFVGAGALNEVELTRFVATSNAVTA
jgi:EAL domain-containing protein (putative c-di-GMP-specific phosphodiesterase class I)